jgi:hypothetical protein
MSLVRTNVNKIANCEPDTGLFFSTLAEKYNASLTMVELTQEEEDFLNDVSNDINNNLVKQQLVFNVEDFKNSVKKIYSIIKSNGQFGGVDPYDESIVQYQTQRKFKINNYDLIAAGSFILGLLCIVIAWYKLTNVLSLIPLSDNFNDEVKKAFYDNLKNVPIQNLNLFAYIFKVMTGMTGQILMSQQESIQLFLKDILYNVVKNASGQAIANCFNKTPTSYFGAITNIVTAYVSPQAVQNCILQTGKEYVNYQMNLLTINISSNMDSISNLTTFGTRLTYASVGYISYRIGLLRSPAISNYERRQVERGGYKRKSSKKTKKSNKTKKSKITKKTKRTNKSKKSTHRKKNRT